MKKADKHISSIIDCLKQSSDDGQIYWREYPVCRGEYFLPYRFYLSVTIDGVLFESWGSDHNKDKAMFKCFAELLERILLRNYYPLFYKQCGSSFVSKPLSIFEIEANYKHAKNWLGTTSSGVAIHTDLKSAISNALSELIERHTILKALAIKCPPCKIDQFPKHLAKYKTPSSVKIDYFYWMGALEYYVVICRIKSGNGYLYTFGTDKNFDRAFEKAFFEGIGHIVYTHNQKNIPEKRDELINSNCLLTGRDKNETTLDTIMDYHLQKEETTTTKLFAKASTEVSIIDSDIKEKDFYYSKLISPSFLGNLKDWVGVRVVSPLTQPLFVDSWSKQVINPLAIKSVLYELPDDLHIIS